MKLIYITGPTSTGKTTLANRISNNASVLSLDAFSKSVRFAFDDFKLYTDKISIRPSINNDKFLLLIKNYIDCFANDYPDKTLVVEGCHFTPGEFLDVYPDAEVIAIGITDESKALKQINKRDWMSNLDMSIQNEYVRQIVKYSLELKANQGKYRYVEMEY